MSQNFRAPSNPEEVKKWIDSIPFFREDQAKDTSFKSREEIVELQNANLSSQMKRLNQLSPYYRKKFKEWSIDPEKIKTVDDLEKIPLTSKTEYMEDMGESFNLEMDINHISDHINYEITYTTGTTTGKPAKFYNTTYDMFMLSWMFRIGCKICYLEPEDSMMNLFPFHFIPHIGFYRTWHFAAAVGMNLSFGFTGSPLPNFPHKIHRSMQKAIEDIEKKKVNVLNGIGSYVRRLVMMAEEQGRDFSRINKVQVVGEAVPAGMREDIRERLQNMGASDVFISNAFGFTEAQTSFQECSELGGAHVGTPELFYIEAVDPKTGKRKAEGESGHLAITHLDRRGTCLLRYLVGDIVALTHKTCPVCGRNDVRIIPAVGSTYGTRTKELLKIKGTLINPQAMFDAVINTGGVLEFQFVVAKEKEEDPYSMDTLKLRVGTAAGFDQEKLKAELVENVQRAVEIRPQVEFVDRLTDIFNPAQSLKPTRLIDTRPVEQESL